MALIQRGSNVSVSVSTNEESILQDGLAHNSDIHQNRVQSYMFLVKWTNVCAHRIGLIKYFLALSQGFNYFLTGILRMLTSETGSSGRRYPMPCRGGRPICRIRYPKRLPRAGQYVGLDIRCPAGGRPSKKKLGNHLKVNFQMVSQLFL